MKYLVLIALVACSSRDDAAPHVRKKPVPAEPDSHLPRVLPTPHTPDPMPSGADSLYPTARRAGTEDLFFLEEPVRGPHVTQLALPDRAKLTFDLRAWCEIDELTVVCDHDKPAAKDRASVSVGMDHGRPVLIEWKLGKRVDETVVLSYNAAGAIERMARLDATGTIDWVRTYAPAGKRYTARYLSGANALPGCGAIELAVDNDRATARTCLQWLGDEMRDTNGVVRTEYERDKDGFVIAETRMGFGGRLVDGARDLVHRVDTTRDRLGRPTKLRFQAVAGHAVGSAEENGCAGIDIAYDRNQTHLRTCIDDVGKVTADETGVTIDAYDHDQDGCVVATRYLDAKEKPTSRDGIHAIEEQNDAHCYTVVKTCLDVAKQRVPCGPGEPAEYRYVRDAHGWITSTTYFAADGTMTVDPSYGVAEVRNVRDDLGNSTEDTCFDASGSAVECSGTGFHRSVDVYDDNGRYIEERYYDAYGSTASNMGTVVRKFIYDNYDHLTESQNYDDSGQLFEVEGMAIRRTYYDDSHRMFGVVLLDASGNPASYTSCFTGRTCPQGVAWHAVRLVRSPAGRVISNVYFDTAGQQIETLDCTTAQCWGDD